MRANSLWVCMRDDTDDSERQLAVLWRAWISPTTNESSDPNSGLPVGEELPFFLEPTRPQQRQEKWEKERGTVLRLRHGMPAGRLGAMGPRPRGRHCRRSGYPRDPRSVVAVVGLLLRPLGSVSS